MGTKPDAQVVSGFPPLTTPCSVAQLQEWYKNVAAANVGDTAEIVTTANSITVEDKVVAP